VSDGADVNKPSSDLSENCPKLRLRFKIVKLGNGFGFVYDFVSKNLKVFFHSLCFEATVSIVTLTAVFCLEEVMLLVYLSTSDSIVLAFFSL